MRIPFLSSKDTRRSALMGLLIAMVCSNSTPIFSKTLYDQGWTPMGTYFMTLIIMTLLLAVHEFMALERGERWGMDRSDVLGTLLTTLTGGVLSPLLFFLGLSYVQASESVLLTSLLPLFIVVFAVTILKEHFTRATVTGSLLLLAGIAVLLWPDVRDARLTIGAPLLVGSTVFGALTTIAHKKYVRHRHLDSVVLVRSILSLLIFGILMFFFEPESLTLLFEPQSVLLILGLPIVGFLIPFFLYFRALAHVKAMDAGLVAAMGPVAGIILAAGFRGEQITMHQVISLGFVVAGILAINVPLTRLRIVPSRLLELGPLRK